MGFSDLANLTGTARLQRGACAIDRLLRCALDLGAGKTVTVAEIQSAFGVSLATAKRDLVRLELALPVERIEMPRTSNRGGLPTPGLRLIRGATLLPMLRAAAV